MIASRIIHSSRYLSELVSLIAALYSPTSSPDMLSGDGLTLNTLVKKNSAATTSFLGQEVADTEKSFRIHTEFLSSQFFSLPN